MSETRKTTRESDFYQNLLRSRIISESEYESKIIDISGEIEWSFDWTAKWESLQKTGRERSLGKDEVITLKTVNSSKCADSVYKNSSMHDWKADGKIVPIFHGEIVLQLPDGEKVCGKFEADITSYDSPIQSILKSYTDGEYINAIHKHDGILLKNGDDELMLTNINNSETTGIDSTQDFDLFVQYLGEGDRWVEADFGSLRHTERNQSDDQKACLVINVNTATTTFEFTCPSSEDSPLWELANRYGHGDPLNLEGEKIKFGFAPFINKSVATHHNEIWAVGSDIVQYNAVQQLIQRAIRFFK